MQITFKLFATLTDYLPPEARRGNQLTLDVPPDAPIARIIEPYGLPPKLVHLVRLPVLRVGFAFEGVDADQRQRFMKRFDLYMQRGGG